MFSCSSCPTPCDPMDSSPRGSSLHRILQVKMLEWIAIPFSRGSFQPRDWTQVSCTGRWIIYCWAPTYTNLIINWNQDATYWVLAGLSPKKWVFKWVQETKPTSMAILLSFLFAQVHFGTHSQSLAIRMFSSSTRRAPFQGKFHVQLLCRKGEGREPFLNLLSVKCLQLKIINILKCHILALEDLNSFSTL